MMRLALFAMASLHLALCTGNENFLEFRQTAGPGIESGVLEILAGGEGSGDGFNTILTAVINGLFEIVEPDSSTGRP